MPRWKRPINRARLPALSDSATPDFAALVAARSVQNLTVLITGAGSGIGRATAEIFASGGAAVMVSDVDGARAAATAAAIVAAGGVARHCTLDVTDEAAIFACVAHTAAAFGGLDIVINNAGIAGFIAIDDAGYDAVFGKILDVVLTSQQRVVRAALPYLRKSSCARIVNIASTEGLGATRHDSAYAAAKAGVIGLTRALAVDLGQAGITVNCICPGPVLTGMTQGIAPEQREAFARRRTAVGRYGQAHEIGQVILGICVPGAGFLTGAIIPVDGGLMARNG